MIKSHSRGHVIEFLNGEWVYSDDKTPISQERPCIRCGRMPTQQGHDACLGAIAGATSACCGHGVEAGYIK